MADNTSTIHSTLKTVLSLPEFEEALKEFGQCGFNSKTNAKKLKSTVLALPHNAEMLDRTAVFLIDCHSAVMHGPELGEGQDRASIALSKLQADNLNILGLIAISFFASGLMSGIQLVALRDSEHEA